MFPLPFVLQLLMPMVISTITSHLGSVGKIDSTQLKIEIDGKVRSIVPGTILDDTAVRFVNRLVDNVQAALLDSAEEAKVLKMLADGQWTDAAQEVTRHAFPDLKAAVAA